ncbi:hypothetical protein [Tellurirhabdus bombi]|uniref:hypothetical protein n=1 Tax=Tellurirhabdus bombi TaxID=2907205 RepID=UPI001F2FC8E9|nr:hypothetical protein [Tellurirhabdus bombi]
MEDENQEYEKHLDSLYKTVSQVQHNCANDERTEKLQSVIGMVYSILLIEGPHNLDEVLRVNYPNYYDDGEIPLLGYGETDN